MVVALALVFSVDDFETEALDGRRRLLSLLADTLFPVFGLDGRLSLTSVILLS